MKAIPEAEYRARLNTFLHEHGPNSGNGFFGRMAWHVVKEREFRERYGVRPLMPESTARPSSFTDFWRRNVGRSNGQELKS